MDNVQAAMLSPQMDRLETNWRRRQALARRYEEGLAGIPGLSWPKTLPGVSHARHLFPVWVQDGRRDALIKGLQAAGIAVVVNYRAIHLLTYFQQTLKHQRGDFPIAEQIGDGTLSLPLYPTMPDEHVDIVVAALRHLLGRAS